MNDECIFCNIIHNKDKELINQPLYKDDDFYIKLGKGVIVPGYLMTIPNKHILSSANLPIGKQKKLFILMDKTRELLEDIFNEPVINFESGSADGVPKFANSILHAHIHTVPIELSPEYSAEMKASMFLEPFDYKTEMSKLAHKAYSFYVDGDKQGYFATSLDRPRQIFRKVIAKQLGKPDEWNWRDDANESQENIKISLEKVAPKLKALNKANFYFEKTLISL